MLPQLVGCIGLACDCSSVKPLRSRHRATWRPTWLTITLYISCALRLGSVFVSSGLLTVTISIFASLFADLVANADIGAAVFPALCASTWDCVSIPSDMQLTVVCIPCASAYLGTALATVTVESTGCRPGSRSGCVTRSWLWFGFRIRCRHILPQPIQSYQRGTRFPRDLGSCCRFTGPFAWISESAIEATPSYFLLIDDWTRNNLFLRMPTSARFKS